MNIRSWKQLGLDERRVLFFGAGAGAALFAAVSVTCQALQVGPASTFLGAVAACGVSYIVFTAPRRSIDRASFDQTVEAPSFAAASNIYLSSTCSRSKTLLLLRAEEPYLSSFLLRVKKKVLLGHDAPAATRDCMPQNYLFSESIRGVLNSIVGLSRTRVEEGGEELDAILSSSGLDEETKLPVFISVAFFLPIMLMLFSAMAKQITPLALGALFVLEAIILDIVLAVSRTSLGWGRKEQRSGR